MEEITLILYKLSEIQDRILFMRPKSFYEVSITPIPKADKKITIEENYRPKYFMDIKTTLHQILATQI